MTRRAGTGVFSDHARVDPAAGCRGSGDTRPVHLRRCVRGLQPGIRCPYRRPAAERRPVVDRGGTTAAGTIRSRSLSQPEVEHPLRAGPDGHARLLRHERLGPVHCRSARARPGGTPAASCSATEAPATRTRQRRVLRRAGADSRAPDPLRQHRARVAAAASTADRLRVEQDRGVDVSASAASGHRGGDFGHPESGDRAGLQRHCVQRCLAAATRRDGTRQVLTTRRALRPHGSLPPMPW